MLPGQGFLRAGWMPALPTALAVLPGDGQQPVHALTQIYAVVSPQAAVRKPGSLLPPAESYTPMSSTRVPAPSGSTRRV